MDVKVSLRPLTTENFRPYGKLIGYPGKEKKGKVKNLWRIVHTENKPYGWRIAYLIVRDKSLRRLEHHPHSFETFEPVSGKSILFVSKKKDTASIIGFVLDKPILLNKNIWHGIITITDEAEIKLTENAKVKCVYWVLGFKLKKDLLWKSG